MTTLSFAHSASAVAPIYMIVSARSLIQKGNQKYSSRAGQVTIIIFLTSNGSLSIADLESRKEIEIKCGTCLVLKGGDSDQLVTWEVPNSFVEIVIDDRFLLRTLETLQLNFTCLKHIVPHYGPEFGFDGVARRVVEKISEGINTYASLVRTGFHCPGAARFIIAMMLKGPKRNECDYEVKSPKLCLPESRFTKVAEYIEQRINYSIHVGELASIAAQSHFHFTRTFKARTGQSPHAYIVGHRLRRAEYMLAESNLSLAQISQECGFSSQSHFSTAFKQHVGITPGQYRDLWFN
ncbi:helix-turn-helix domain-containing protein [Pseudomonas sp.]|uniref:helix-turn-helix domain-containing protein n=1 Tax=Pseudomonas sp. TaxID=306 RepID=UPI003A979377